MIDKRKILEKLTIIDRLSFVITSFSGVLVTLLMLKKNLSKDDILDPLLILLGIFVGLLLFLFFYVIFSGVNYLLLYFLSKMALPKIISSIPKQIVSSRFPSWCDSVILKSYYRQERYSEIIDMQECFSSKVLNEFDFESVMFLFKTYKLNISNYEPESHLTDILTSQVLRFVSKQDNMLDYKELIPKYIYHQLCVKSQRSTFSEENVYKGILPLKKKDIPLDLFDVSGKVNLNYLNYLLLIPNRKTMTIDNLRKLTHFYPPILVDLEMIDYWKDNEIFLPYSESRIMKLLMQGMNSSDLIDLAKIQRKGIEIQYPEKPASFNILMKHILENNPAASSFIKSDLENNNNDYFFDPYKKISTLKNLDGIKYKDCTLRVMKNSYELSELGRKLNLCVGSYPSRGLMRKFQIISVERDGQPVYCVSIDVSTKKVSQMKSKHNMPVVESKLKYFINSRL